MAQHKPSLIWHTRLETDRPYQTVRTVDSATISIGFMPGNGMAGYGIYLRRSDARLLARRIEQCLKATVCK